MNFRQWLSHVRSWWLMVTDFPLPRDKTHAWVGVVGEKEQTCLICGAEGIDRDISDEQLERDRAMNEEYSKLSEKYFGKDEDG